MLCFIPGFARYRAALENDAATRPAQTNSEVAHPLTQSPQRSFAFRESYFRLFCWVTMLYSGFATIVAGTSAEKYGGGWKVAFVTYEIAAILCMQKPY